MLLLNDGLPTNPPSGPSASTSPRWCSWAGCHTSGYFMVIDRMAALNLEGGLAVSRREGTADGARFPHAAAVILHWSLLSSA